MRIGCLHTAQSNVAVLNEAAAALGAERPDLVHIVRPELLAAVETVGRLTPEVAETTEASLRELAATCDAVVLTCSSLGPVADGMKGLPVVRLDAALADQATGQGGRVIALIAAPTTVAPTETLFSAAAGASGAHIEVRLVEGAWDLFKAGDRAGYRSRIVAAAEAAYADGAAVVALGQASMADAASAFGAPKMPLTSPVAGLRSALKLARS